MFMGLKIRETSGIQRNLPTQQRYNSNMQQQAAANHLSNSNNSISTPAACSGGNTLRLNTEAVVQSQERQLNAAKRSILRMLGEKNSKIKPTLASFTTHLLQG